MEKSNINRIIRKFLSARFSPDTEEKVQKWIIEDKDIEAKEKASLEYWNELDVKPDPGTYSALERVNLRTGYNKEHLENIVSYQKFTRIAALIIPALMLAGGILYYMPFKNEMMEISTAYGEQKAGGSAGQFRNMAQRRKYSYFSGSFCKRQTTCNSRR